MTSIKESLGKKIFSNKKGVSLIEIVAALSIFVMLFVGVIQLISSASKSEISTNTSMDNINVNEGIRDILFGESGQFFEKFLNGKTIILEGTDLYSIEKLLSSNIGTGEVLSNNKYISKNSKEDQIKYKVYITTKENDKGLYSVVVTCITLKNTQYYYYENGLVEGNGQGTNVTPSNKDFQSLSEEMVIRPIN